MTLQGIGMTSQRTRARMVERLRTQGIRDERVLAAMGEVPRHIFVEPALSHRAYEDTALPLILGQTISQPYVVARMIELLLGGRPGLGKTLEVGAGCGYQAAVLAMLTKDVYAVERIAPLLAKARDNLRPLKLHGLRLKHEVVEGLIIDTRRFIARDAQCGGAGRLRRFGGSGDLVQHRVSQSFYSVRFAVGFSSHARFRRVFQELSIISPPLPTKVGGHRRDRLSRPDRPETVGQQKPIQR